MIMTHYACIAIGMADCMPDEQFYITAETGDELSALVEAQCRDFDDMADEAEIGNPIRYPFHTPRDGENNYSQRLRIGRDRDMVLDVIGMTADEYYREFDD